MNIELRNTDDIRPYSPIPRSVQPPEKGRVVAKAYLGGLHHCYSRAA